jgi:hypothetical protein
MSGTLLRDRGKGPKSVAGRGALATSSNESTTPHERPGISDDDSAPHAGWAARPSVCTPAALRAARSAGAASLRRTPCLRRLGLHEPAQGPAARSRRCAAAVEAAARCAARSSDPRDRACRRERPRARRPSAESLRALSRSDGRARRRPSSDRKAARRSRVGARLDGRAGALRRTDRGAAFLSSAR